jgi:hypothetical protein
MKAGVPDGGYRTLANTFGGAFDTCRYEQRKTPQTP